MSGLVLKLQYDAQSDEVSCATLLRKALAVSTKLNITEIEEWLLHEVGGYPIDVENVPEYREVQGEIKVLNPYRGWQPLVFRDSKLTENLSKRILMQSVGELEALLKQKRDEVLMIPYHPQIEKTLSEAMEIPLQPMLHVPITSITRILDVVRYHVLEWALKLEKEGIIGEGLSFSKEEQEKSDSISYKIFNYIENVNNLQIQQHSPEAVQIQHFCLDMEKILTTVSEIRANQEKLDLSAESGSKLNDQLSTIEQQSQSPKPKESIISEALKSIRGILEGATGNIVAAGLLKMLAKII